MAPEEQVEANFERDLVEQARAMSFEQRFLAGAELFDYACEIAIGGIRSQFPHWSPQQQMEELRRRVQIGEEE
jgi:hypothetical protein